MNKILLVIDLQKEFYSENKEQKLLDFIKKNRDKYAKIVATLFVNDRNANINYERELNWCDCADADENSLEFYYDKLFIKNGYGITFESLEELYGYEIDVIGCDTDACVLANSYLLFDNGVKFNILTDYIYSSGAENMHEFGVEIMKRNFGKCVK